METIFNYICLHADGAHWFLFFLLLLAGLNIPISEDALLIIGGALASTCVTHHPFEMWAFLYLGCWISAWEAYWLGRILGPKLYHIGFFKRIINPSRIRRMRYYYEKFGILTFIVGRFIPGGVRNALFMTTGLSKMPFGRFLFRDAIACLISTTTLFYLGYKFGENHEVLLHAAKKYQLFVIGFIGLGLVSLISILWWRHSRKVANRHKTVDR